MATQECVATGLTTTCRPCASFTDHSLWRVSYSRFGTQPHHVLNCSQCGNERRLETNNEDPVIDCACGERVLSGSALCATCARDNETIRAKSEVSP
jgi:hypothetical protein